MRSSATYCVMNSAMILNRICVSRRKMLPKECSMLFIITKDTSIQQFRHNSSQAKLDISEPYAYYTVLGINKNAKQSEVKKAYFDMVKIYHPDVNDSENARENFEKITEAYSTLIDLTQRYFYDQHGISSKELKEKGSNSTIFDWVPKYTLYEERTRADSESNEVEDWFKAQGHVGHDVKISFKQRLKNAYVELRYGLGYYDFPWQWKSFFGWLSAWIVIIFAMIKLLNYSMQKISWRKPVPIYLKWENDEIYDILWYVGARKNKSDVNHDKGLIFPTNSKGKVPESELARAGMYHMPKRGKKKSEYSHTIYSNTRSRTKSKNIERHKARMEEQKQKDKDKKNNQTKDKSKKVNDGFSL